MLNSRSKPVLRNICLVVSLSMDSRAACSILGRCETSKVSGGFILANVSSSFAVTLDVFGDSFEQRFEFRRNCFDDRQLTGLLLLGNEIVQKRIALAEVLFRARFKDGASRQDPNRSKSNREPRSVFHRSSRIPDALTAAPIVAERTRVGHRPLGRVPMSNSWGCWPTRGPSATIARRCSPVRRETC